MSSRLKIAIPVGDPAGIGPEIALKAALDPAVRAACDPMLVCDPLCSNATPSLAGSSRLSANQRAGLSATGNGVARLRRRQPGERPRLDCVLRRRREGRDGGDVDAVVAAPQHETSIAQAGIPFDGHPSFVARQTGADENGVYMMLCFGDTRIAHCTLHRSVREAIALITRENVARTIRATDVR
jgi:4-hydroxy-L-threonine phosphate dehydrogenase PdxA